MFSLFNLFAFSAAIGFFALILFVVFGQVTVRKLRKNPKTKGALGIEFMSGWDIINVAQALSIPKSWRKKLEGSPLSSLYANSEVLIQNTTKLDRIIGGVFYWLFMVSGLMLASLGLLDTLGVFS